MIAAILALALAGGTPVPGTPYAYESSLCGPTGKCTLLPPVCIGPLPDGGCIATIYPDGGSTFTGGGGGGPTNTILEPTSFTADGGDGGQSFSIDGTGTIMWDPLQSSGSFVPPFGGFAPALCVDAGNEVAIGSPCLAFDPNYVRWTLVTQNGDGSAFNAMFIDPSNTYSCMVADGGTCGYSYGWPSTSVLQADSIGSASLDYNSGKNAPLVVQEGMDVAAVDNIPPITYGDSPAGSNWLGGGDPYSGQPRMQWTIWGDIFGIGSAGISGPDGPVFAGNHSDGGGVACLAPNPDQAHTSQWNAASRFCSRAAGNFAEGSLSVSGGLKVDGGSTLVHGVSVSGGLASDTLQVSGPAGFDGGVIINNGGTWNGTVSIPGFVFTPLTLYISGAFGVDGGTALSHGASVTGGLTTDTLASSGITNTGSLANTGPVYFSSTAGVDAGLTVAQGVVISAGGLTSTGPLANTGPIYGSSTLGIDAGATIAQGLTVSAGGITSTGPLANTGAFSLTGPAYVSATLGVDAGLTVNQLATLGAGLTLTGAFADTGTAYISAGFGADGGSTLLHGLTVGGGETLTGGLTTDTLSITQTTGPNITFAGLGELQSGSATSLSLLGNLAAGSTSGDVSIGATATRTAGQLVNFVNTGSFAEASINWEGDFTTLGAGIFHGSMAVDAGLTVSNGAVISGGLSAPIFMDGSPVTASQTNDTTHNTITNVVTTNYAAELLVVVVSSGGNTGTQPVTLAGGSLTWTQVAVGVNGSFNNYDSIWEATTSTTLASSTLTATFNTTGQHSAVMTTYKFVGALGVPGVVDFFGNGGAPTRALDSTFAGLVPGAWLVGAYGSGNGFVTLSAQSGTTIDVQTGDSTAGQTVSAMHAGPVTGGSQVFGSTLGAVSFNFGAAVEILPSTATPPQFPGYSPGPVQVDGGISSDTLTLDGTAPQLTLTPSGAGITFSGGGTTLIQETASGGALKFEDDLTAGASGTGFIFASQTTRTAGRLFEYDNNGTLELHLDFDGSLNLHSGNTLKTDLIADATGSGSLTLQSDLTAGSASTDFILNSKAATRTAGNLLALENNGSAKFTVGFAGALTGASLSLSSTTLPQISCSGAANCEIQSVSGQELALLGNQIAGSSSPDVVLGNTTVTRTAGSLVSVFNHASSVLTVDWLGDLSSSGSLSGTTLSLSGSSANVEAYQAFPVSGYQASNASLTSGTLDFQAATAPVTMTAGHGACTVQIITAGVGTASNVTVGLLDQTASSTNIVNPVTFACNHAATTTAPITVTGIAGGNITAADVLLLYETGITGCTQAPVISTTCWYAP